MFLKWDPAKKIEKYPQTFLKARISSKYSSNYFVSSMASKSLSNTQAFFFLVCMYYSATFSFGPLYLIGMWFGDVNQKNKHQKDAFLKEIGVHLQALLTTPHSIVNTIGRRCVFESRNQQTSTYDNHKKI